MHNTYAIDSQTYVRTAYMAVHLEACRIFSDALIKLDQPFSFQMMRTVWSQPANVQHFQALAMGYSQPASCEDLILDPLSFMAALDRDIAEFLDPALYPNDRQVPVDPSHPERPWIANLIRQSLIVCYSGAQLLQTAMPASEAIHLERLALIQNFEHLFPDYVEILKQIAPCTEDPAHHWPPPLPPDPEFVRHCRSMPPDPDELECSRIKLQIQNRLPIGLSIPDLEVMLNAVVKDVRSEHAAAEQNPAVALCLTKLDQMRLMNWMLLHSLENGLYSPLQNICFFTDMHADLVQSFWSHYHTAYAEVAV